ncbi:hypothetical protein AMATHDRAFT_9518 [Amanita thiersii Skay4041]|uniref:CCHC-type domain-containing protein n=1 Tax=Amanita thiersii Skay4041 TaxID=703135 RepID=A0A2A9NCH5_9AGAR|nr:hypothetical protein AMATHDRAFT_9518 [Amanita thiersii Skay4041]
MSTKPQEFPTLCIKITWVLGFMQTGMVQLFWDHFLTYMLTPDYQIQYEQSNKPDQIELLYWDIYKAFGDLNKQATAIQEITTIKQGSRSGEEHIQLFKQSYMRSGYGEVAGIHEFKCSLNSPLLDKSMAVPNLPTTLDKWYNLVIWLDLNGDRQLQKERLLLCMEVVALVDKLVQHNIPINKDRLQEPCNDQALINKLREIGNHLHTNPNNHSGDLLYNQCYNCGQTGHMAQVCPNPWQQQMRLVSAWNSGTDEDQNKLWWMVTGGSDQVGGGVAHTEEVLVVTPVVNATAAQPPVLPYAPQGFQFGQ